MQVPSTSASAVVIEDMVLSRINGVNGHMYETKVEDFGCIQCLGASPDGINTETNSNLYGRMVEIKNIVFG